MSPELIERIRLASVGQSNTSLVVLTEQYQRYCEIHCATSTLRPRMCRLKSFGEFLLKAGLNDVLELNNAVLSIFFDEYALGVKTSSANAMRRDVKAFISWVEGYKEIGTFVRIGSIGLAKEGKRNPRYIDSNVVEQLINSHEFSYLDRLLIAVGFGLGLRASEMANMKIADIVGDQLDVVGKGDQERSVTIPQYVAKMIDTYLQMAPYSINNGYIFQSYWRGEWRQMKPKTIWRRLKNIFVVAGYPEASPHWLRHSYAVDLLQKGCDIVTIQKSLGHSDIAVTQKYLNIANEIVAKNIHKYLG